MEPDLTLSSYRIFNTVAQTGNYSRAARELTISQPAVSQAVARLEQSLAVKLFSRESHGMKLTEEGNLLYGYTRSAFRLLKCGEESIHNLHSVTGETKIGASPFLCNHLLLPGLPDFTRNFPRLSPDVVCQPSSELLRLLSLRRLDAALVEEPDSGHTYLFTPLLQCKGLFIASPYFSATSNQTSAPVSLFLSKETANVIRQIRNMQKVSGRKDIRIVETESIELLHNFVKAGLGYGYTYPELISGEIKRKELIPVEALYPVTPTIFGLLCFPENFRSAGLKAIADFYKGGTLV